MSCMEYERVAYDQSLPLDRRMVAVKAMLRLDQLKRKHALARAQQGEVNMEKKTRIVIDCEGEAHELHIDGKTIECDGLEAVAQALEPAELERAA